MGRARLGLVDLDRESICERLAEHGVVFARAEHVIDAIPQKEFHLIKDAAHWAQWEKPDEVNPLMIDFLSRIAP